MKNQLSDPNLPNALNPMNTPSPLIPQGSLLEQQKSKGKSNLFIAVFTILTIHVVLFAGLLMQGCKREKAGASLQEPTNALASDQNVFAPSNLPSPPTNSYYTEPPSNPAPLASVVETQKPPFAVPPTHFTETPIAPVTPAPSTITGKTYTVVRNDSFYKIAKAHGVSIKAIEEANPDVDPRKLKAGQTLTIPSPATPSSENGSPAVGGAASPDTDTSVYYVKAGDTLTRIAKLHSTTIKALRSLNNLKSDRLHVGQKIKIPASKAPAGSEPASFSLPRKQNKSVV